MMRKIRLMPDQNIGNIGLEEALILLPKDLEIERSSGQ
jgi:hypothetical protein